MTEIEEAKRRKKRKNKIKVTYTTGDPELNIKHFNKMMGTDFNNPSTEEAKAAAKGANANMGIESNGSFGNADVGEIVGGTNDAGTDFSGDCGGEGMGESLELHEAKREVRRYFIRPQHIFCANKAEVIKALIDIGENNCSVYTLKYLGDEKDITKLTNKDIIYYYDDGILYDKNHVKVMDYDLYIKHEEERKKFSQPADEIPAKEFDKEYDDRITHRTEFEEDLNNNAFKNLPSLSNLHQKLIARSQYTYPWVDIAYISDETDFRIKGVVVMVSLKDSSYHLTCSEDVYLDDDGGSNDFIFSEENEDIVYAIYDQYRRNYNSFEELVSVLRNIAKIAIKNNSDIKWDYDIFSEIPTKEPKTIDDPQIEFKESLGQKKPIEQLLPDLANWSEVKPNFWETLFNLGTAEDAFDFSIDGEPVWGIEYLVKYYSEEDKYLIYANYLARHGGSEPADLEDEDKNEDTEYWDCYKVFKGPLSFLQWLQKLIADSDFYVGSNLEAYDLTQLPDFIKKLSQNNTIITKKAEVIDDPQIEFKESLIEELNPFEQDFPRINAFGEDLDHPKHVCCICGEEFEGYGNNPAPVKNDGVCCDACNLKFVIPARLDQANAEEDDLNK